MLQGVVTDADVRRYILRGGALTGPVRDMANYSPKSLPIERRREAKRLMLEKAIGAVPLLDKQGRIEDVAFAAGLDIDTRKRANLPVVMMAGALAQGCTLTPKFCQSR